jgi:hypothetical protein
MTELFNRSVPKGFIQVFQNHDNFVTIRQGNGPFVMSGGYGGWSAISRPREDAIVEWLGHDVMLLSGPVLFDGILPDLGGEPEELPWGDSVERDIRMLEHLTHKLPHYDSPPRVAVLGETVPHRDREWVLNDIKWAGDDIRRPTDGDRVRASATLEFMEYQDWDIISGRLSAAGRRRHKKGTTITTKAKKGSYVVKEGDTLRKIAKKELGSASKWHEIAAANHIRDGKAVRPGTRLKIP